MIHIPKPWTPDFDVEPGRDIPIRVNLPCINGLNAWFEIGKVFAFDESETGYTEGVLNADATIANARLIAAAPDLLEALKEAANWMEAELKNIGGCDHNVGICCCGDYSMLESFRAAIAKAES